MFLGSTQISREIAVPMHTQEKEKVAVVVGLGNPGKQYENTRHNVGFQVVDELAHQFHVHLQERKFRASWGMGTIEGQRVLLFKPLTFMNRSGEAVKEMLGYFGISARQTLVVHDDLDLPCGRIKLARRGGAGGHRGVLSIIEHVKSRDFPRLKLGIGRPLQGETVEAYVLQIPYPQQAEVFQKMISRGVKGVQAVLVSDLEEVMSRFNRRSPRVEDD